jgi:hypothetical protein
MFTLQSGQIENALRLGGMQDISAKEMMQGMANCAAPLEHRGPVALTQPVVNFFPTITPPGAPPNVRISGPQLKNVFIDIPPFVPYVPPLIPYPPADEWRDIPYFDQPILSVQGPADLGPVTSDSVTTGPLDATQITNSGDVVNQGDIINQGDTTNYGDTVTTNQTVQNTSVANNTVINNGDVINLGSVHNEVSHNYETHNYGPTYNHSETWMYDQINMLGPVVLQQPPVVAGLPVNPFDVDIVVDVIWDGSTLTKRVASCTVFGIKRQEADTLVLDCNA